MLGCGAEASVSPSLPSPAHHGQTGESGPCSGQVGDSSPRGGGASAEPLTFHSAPPTLRSAKPFSLAAGSLELIMMRECKCQRDPSFNSELLKNKPAVLAPPEVS